MNDESEKQTESTLEDRPPEGVFGVWPHSGYGIASFVIFAAILIFDVLVGFVLSRLYHHQANVAGFALIISGIGWIIGFWLSIKGLLQDFRDKFFAILSFILYLLVPVFFICAAFLIFG